MTGFLVVTYRDDFAETGLLVELVTVGHAFDHVLESHLTVVLRNDHGIVRIPLADQIAFLDRVAVVHVEHRAVRQVMRIKHDAGTLVDDAQLGQTADDHVDLLAVVAFALDDAQLVDLDTALVA